MKFTNRLTKSEQCPKLNRFQTEHLSDNSDNWSAAATPKLNSFSLYMNFRVSKLKIQKKQAELNSINSFRWNWNLNSGRCDEYAEVERERERERERECVNEPFWFLVGLLWIYTRVETRSWCVDADVRFGNKMTPRRNVTGQWGVRAVKRRTKGSRVKRFCTLVTHGLSDFIIAPNDVNTLSISRGRNFRLAVSFAPVCVSNKFKSVVLFIYNL